MLFLEANADVPEMALAVGRHRSDAGKVFLEAEAGKSFFCLKVFPFFFWGGGGGRVTRSQVSESNNLSFFGLQFAGFVAQEPIRESWRAPVFSTNAKEKDMKENKN